MASVPADNEALIELDACADLPVEVSGGKATVLARLGRAGFDVLPGLVLTTSAARTVRASGGVLPDPLALALVARWRETGWPRVAVRSSGVLEDSAGLSLAGQLETILDVADPAGLVAAVESVLASAQAPRVKAYLERRMPDVDPDRLPSACLIQPLLEPDCAGVAFTVDPVTGCRDRMVVECVRGRGDALVSGAVEPERHILSRPDLRLLSHRSGDAEVRVLDTQGAQRIASIAQSIETLFGVPQDVEWALVGGRVIVLQARPVTVLDCALEQPSAALAEEFARLTERHGPDRGLWANLFAAELLPTPTRASLELLLAMGEPGSAGVFLAFERDLGLGRVRHRIVADTVCGRLYADVRSVERILADLGLPLRLVPPPTEAAWPGLELRWVRVRWSRLPWALVRLLWRAPRMALRLRTLLRDGARQFWEQDLPALEREVALASVDLQDLDDVALLRALDAARAWCSGPGRRTWERCNQAALISFGILAARTRLWLGDRNASLATDLIRGASGNATLELNEAISEAAQVAREFGSDSSAFEETMERLLIRYGHRASTELELAEPRWREDPRVLRTAALRLVESGPLPERAPPALEPIVARVRPWRRYALRRAIASARRNAPLRETPKFHYLRRFEQLRLLYLEVGRRAAERGGLVECDHVFCLARDELPTALGPGASAAAVAAEASSRRMNRAALLQLPPLPALFRSECLEEIVRRAQAYSSETDVPTLRGDGVSPGRAIGRAWVVSDPAEARAPGDDAILVAPRADPGWTPLFLSVRAVVLETGSAVSHSSIVAREYGLPMIVNVAGATERLADGTRLCVDGGEGWVRIETPQSRS